ncbi:MAG: YraN family protein, partial [Acidobacteria bacterium]|nr:YraN family protein [Acidobacteriota bacterium]
MARSGGGGAEPPDPGRPATPVSPHREFRDQPHNRARGASAEADARRWLERHGYVVVVANAVTKAGEIDLVALDGDTLCFVEVKARAGLAFGPAIAAVDARKQHRLARAAALWLAHHPHDGPCRFDVLGLDP